MTGSGGSETIAVGLWPGAPAPDAVEEDWLAYKQRTYVQFVNLIRAVDRELGGQPYQRLEQLRRLRREHHLILVADRIRRESSAGRELSREELRAAAEQIVDRGARLGATGMDETRPMSRADERMMISARVNWHKLLRKAGSRAELRGIWGGKRRYSGIQTAVGRIIGQRPKKDAQMALREYVRDRLEQLLAIYNEVLARAEIAPSRQDRVLARELELLLRRARTAASQRDDTRTRRGRTVRSIKTSSEPLLESGERAALAVDKDQGAMVNAGV